MSATLHADVARFMPEGSLDVPPRVKVAGRFERADVGGEWDWYWALSPADRKRVIRHTRPGGLGPDTCAHAAGFDYVDDWARELVAVLNAKPVDRARDVIELHAPGELVGVDEIAAYCSVPKNTVYVWIKRGRLPAPWDRISSNDVWSRSDIEAWALATGRLVADSSPGF